MTIGQYPAPGHTLVHLSDTHFVGDGERLYGKIDTDRNLTRVFAGLERAQLRPDAFVITGDLTDTGRPDAYARLRDLVEPAAIELGAAVVWVMGNHDERGAFREGLLRTPASQDPVDSVFEVRGLRLVALDSTVPGHHHGEITDAQLDWLADVLAVPAEHGTLLALHHPPVPSPLGLLSLVELTEQHKLASVLEGTDVRGILAGHLHYSSTSTFAGIPVSVASATCYTQDLAVPFPTTRAQDGAQSMNLVHVYGDRLLHSVVPLADFDTVYAVSAAQMAAFLDSPTDTSLGDVSNGSSK